MKKNDFGSWNAKLGMSHLRRAYIPVPHTPAGAVVSGAIMGIKVKKNTYNQGTN
jgi:hypothetical protein